ncbi:glycosyltransferase [Clostridium sp. YIM B02551]|uniref:glycosyltransferase n=1 Tax=Clostridium sp. YIM B02551 TaxID=2910679 RepID=UPI001EEC8E7F|nr:glycosyltransferase [Clostridium sp. YIM B02551]
MKKVLFVIDNLCGGGAEKVLIDILEIIDKSNFEITLLLFEKQGVYLDKIPKDIKVRSIFNHKVNRILKIIFKLLCKINILNIFINEKFDCEIAFLEGDATYIVANSPNKYANKVAWVHTDYKKNRVEKKERERNTYSKFNSIVCVSNGAKDSFVEVFPELSPKVKVIYNLINSNKIISKSIENIEIEEEIDILAIGRLLYVKGFDLLLKAQSNLIKQGIVNNICILGEGSERDNLQKIIDDNNLNETVKLVGFKENPYPYIRKAKMFVMPSRYEGFPLSLCEAIILEKLIISTRCTGPSEILDNGKYGILVDVNEVTELENAIKSMSCDREIQIKYSNEVKSRKQFFNSSEVIASIENLIDSKTKNI